MTRAATRPGLRVAGIVVLLAGLLAGLGLWISAGQRESHAVTNLARAPIGCDTTLDFEAGGEFYIYIESAGRFDGTASGDCGASGDFELLTDSLPPVTLQLTASDGGEVSLDSRSGISYDAGGYVGTSVRVFVVDEPGRYQLRVETPGSSAESFAVAVGRDPADGVGSLRLGALLAVIGGLVVGGLLVLLSRRTRDSSPATDEATWPGQPVGWPTAPPGTPIASPTGSAAPLGPPTHVPEKPQGAAPPAGPAGAVGQGATPAQSGGTSGDGKPLPWAPPSESTQ